MPTSSSAGDRCRPGVTPLGRLAKFAQIGAGFAVITLTACGEATAPPGRAADVTVRAYIDRDNSGTFTTGDDGVGSASLTLTDRTSGTAAGTATTDANGVATFAGVAPGSYSVSATDAPAGTVFAASTTARVTVSYFGAVQAEDLRFAFLPGTVSGRIFRDDNSNGTFETTDTPGAGLAVVLRRNGTRVDSTVTIADGTFRFRYLTPGNYDVVLENPGSISYGTPGASRAVVVAAGEETSITGVFTGSLITSIADVRTKATGSLVAVLGRLTARPGSFPSGTGGVNSEIWVQDATGGIAVFSVPTADSANYVLGDTLEVTGTLTTFSGQKQLGGTALRIVKKQTGPQVLPLAQTIPQAKALTNEGKLVTIPNVRVASVPGGTGTAFTVLVYVGTDTLQVRVAGALTGLTRSDFVVGDRYSMTGILTQFNGTAQLKPRGDADVASAITTIAAIRTQPIGTVATVSGNITVPPNVFTSGTNGVNSEIWVQDATGGIAVFSVLSSESANLALGDRVEVTGTLGTFSGQLQLGTPTVTRISAGTEPVPPVQTGTQVNARTLEGRVVTLPNFTVTTVPTGTGAAFTVVGTADGQTVQVRIAAAQTGLTRANFTVGNTYTVTGVLTQFNGTAQLKPRFRTDLIP